MSRGWHRQRQRRLRWALLKTGARKDATTKEGSTALDATMNAGATALMLSANGGHLSCAQLLINAGADKQVECSFGTALSLARDNGHTTLCELLEA